MPVILDLRQDIEEYVRKHGLSKKWEKATRSRYYSARELKSAGLRMQHPDWNENTVHDKSERSSSEVMHVLHERPLL